MQQLESLGPLAYIPPYWVQPIASELSSRRIWQKILGVNTNNSQLCALGPSPSVQRHVALYLNPHNNQGKLIFTSGTLELEEAEKNNKKQDKQKPTKTPKPEHWKIPLPSFSILVCTESHPQP